jgi:hypothetical protein
MNVLDKHSLDGLCMVAYESCSDVNGVYCIDDTPHVCKQVRAAMKNKLGLGQKYASYVQPKGSASVKAKR